MKLPRGMLAAGVALMVLASPAGASAATRYVADNNGNNNLNDCSASTSPCKTINYAISQASANDTIEVDGGTYAEQVALGSGLSLIAGDFDGVADGTPVIDPGSPAGPTITVPTAAGTLTGFTIRGNDGLISANGSITVTGNTFDEGTSNPDGIIAGAMIVVFGGGTFSDNTFIDPTPGDATPQKALWIFGSGTGPTMVTGNTFTDYSTGVVGATAPVEVDDNTFTGINSGGTAISASNANITAIGNRITAGGTGSSTGFDIADGNGGSAQVVTLRRNIVTGQSAGGKIVGTEGALTLDSDVFANNSGLGLQLLDDNTGTPMTANATNLTITGNVDPTNPGTADLRAQELHLNLDSSILGHGIDTSSGTSCTITRTRASFTGSLGCSNFFTDADPQFVDAAAGNFHLLSTSPMIDAGDPAAPPAGYLDIDGDPRALNGSTTCPVGVARRDIGADEFNPALDCTPPDTTIDSGPSGLIADSTPTFAFHSSEAGSTFECRFDSAPFAACSGPGQTHTPPSPIGDGAHVFEVRATDAAGNPDPTPAARSFNVDAKPPTTSIRRAPKSSSRDRTPTFRFGSNDSKATFLCRLDGKPFVKCPKVKTFHVKPGRHVVKVKAKDAAGNVDPTPAKRFFRVLRRGK